MNLQTVFELPCCRILAGGDPKREVSHIFCCDLLSMAMGKAPAGCVWVTVMGNKNTVAVASLADVACIVLAEGVSMEESALEKAAEERIPVLATDLPVFDAALGIYQAGLL